MTILLFIFDWISDYCNTPEMYLTFTQRVLFAAALLIIGIAITVICSIIYAIGIKITERK